MAIRFLFLSMFFLINTVLSAQGSPIRPYDLPKSYNIKNINSLIIKENGAWSETLSSSDETKDSCASFVLTEREVRDYFKRAVRTDRALWDYLPYSRCYVSGEVVFQNGDRGFWLIDKNRRGRLDFSDGGEAYFYGRHVHNKAFAEVSPYFDNPSYDLDYYPKLPKRSMKIIKSLSIRKSGFKWRVSEKQQAGQCHFTMTEGEIKDFLKRAKVLSLGQYGTIPSAACHIEGDIDYEGGYKGSWLIENEGRGVLNMQDGRVVYLYLKKAAN